MIQPGDTFNRWTILSSATRGKSTTSRWNCKCTCGTERIVRADHLRSGASVSCGCVRTDHVPIKIGDRFSKWTVVGAADNDKQGKKRWLCRCDCGTVRPVGQTKLRNKCTHSCGCPLLRLKDATTAEAEKEQKKAYNKIYRANNASRLKVEAKKYKERNPHVHRTSTQNRRARKRKAVPAWAAKDTRLALKRLAMEAAQIEADTGVKMHIDHIVPLKGKIGTKHVVCGLHVAANLRLLPASDNCVKSCYSWPDMW